MEGWAICPQIEQLPFVAVLCIGVQGKILFVVRALLLKKFGTRPSAPTGARAPPRSGKMPLYPSHGTPAKLAFLGAMVRLSTCSVLKPSKGWKERLMCCERVTGFVGIPRSLA